MDTLSPSGSITSLAAAVPSSASKKLTYTTAGTPYNPTSSQPLQPPTRRGRSLKWGPTGTHSGLALLPKSVLASLPLKQGTRRVSSLQQYTPLQQNYDRAVSPPNDPGHACANMSAQVLRSRSETSPTTLVSRICDEDQDRVTDASPVDEELSDSSNDDSDLSMDPLMNMTVKSLHNLASYPNPNQKKAQKALRRGAKPGFNMLQAVTMEHEAATTRKRGDYCRVDFKKPPTSPASLRPSMSDPPTLRRLQSDAPALSNSTKSLGFVRVEDTTGGDKSVHQPPSSSPEALPSGPGAPRPLTAGPPGQRQYRPSTFESTFKALHTRAQPICIEDGDDPQAWALAQKTLLHAGIDDTFAGRDSVAGATNTAKDMASPTESAYTGPQYNGNRSNSLSKDTEERNGSYASGKQAQLVHEGLFVPLVAQSQLQMLVDRDITSLNNLPRWQSGTDRLTEKELTARAAKINRDWYSGSDLLSKTMDEIAAEAQNRKMERTFGAIGDGRPIKAKKEYRSIDMEEANSMSAAEHARPLVNMAFESILRHVESKSCTEEDGHLENGTFWPSLHKSQGERSSVGKM